MAPGCSSTAGAFQLRWIMRTIRVLVRMILRNSI